MPYSTSILCAALFLLFACQSDPANRPVEGPRSRAVLEAERVGDYFVVSCRIDGRHPARMLLDTGSSHTILDRRLAKTLGYGSPDGEFGLRRLASGPIAYTDAPCLTHDMSGLSETLGRPIDGLLGYCFFENCLLTLDYATSRVVVSDGALQESDGIEVFELDGHGRPYLTLDIQGIRRTCVIDSGGHGGLGLGSLGVFEWESEPVDIGLAQTIRGWEPYQYGRLKGDLRCGPFQLLRPLIKSSNSISMIGTELLRRSVISFDARNRRLRWTAVGDTELRFAGIRGVGIAFVDADDVRLVHTVFDGPARRAGVRAGDVLIAVGEDSGSPASALDQAIKSGAASVALTFLRDGKRITLDMDIVLLVP